MAQPVFRHGVNRQKVRRVERITEQFGKMVASRVKNMINAGVIDIDAETEPTLGNLLSLRKKLVEAVKKGMLERRDQEERIGLLAALVWWNRQEEDVRHRIEQSDLRG